MSWRTFVAGVPRPQGSMTLARDPRTGREFARYSGPTYEWRQTLHIALSRWWDGDPAIDGPVEVAFSFRMPRPKAHIGARGTLKVSAPTYATGSADLDKLVRAVNDGLTVAGVWRDDGQVAVLQAAKLYAAVDERPGVRIEIEELKL